MASPGQLRLPYQPTGYADEEEYELPQDETRQELHAPLDDLQDPDCDLAVDDSDFDTFPVEDESSRALDNSELDIDDFVDDAHLPPTLRAPDAPQRYARMKAAQIVNLIEPRTDTERHDALAYLTDLFEHLPHPATYSAIERLAPQLNIDLIRAMAELREAWLQSESWHLHRYGRDIASTRTNTGGFTWKLAYRLCIARPEFPPEMMIDDDWITEWLHLQPGVKGYYSFASFIARKLTAEDALHTALSLYARHENPETPRFHRAMGAFLALPRS